MANARRLAANLLSGIFNNVFRILFHLAMLPLMARLVGPSELGLYALAAPVLGFVILLSEAGLGDSLAREKSDDTLVWSSAFWGLMGSATVLAVGVYCVSFIVAYVAHQPRLPEIMLPLSLTLFMVAATVIPSARMLRSGNLAPGTIADFFASLVGAAVAICLAYWHFGVWAMVWQVLTICFLRMVLLNLIQPFLPRFEFSLKSLLSHTGVGGAILSTRVIELVGRMGENSQVSRSLGVAALGSYNYANQIGRFFSDAISNPMWANLYYIAINRPPEEVNRHYIMSHRLFALLMFPSAILLALALPTLVPLILGPEWVGSTYPIMMMVLSCPFVALGSYHGAVMFARRNIRIMLYGSTGLMLGRIIVVAGFHVFGITGLTIGLSVINVLYYLFAVVIVSPIIGTRRSDVVSAIVGPALASLVTGVCFYFLLGGAPSFIWLILSGALSLLTYPVALFLLDHRRVRRDLTLVTAVLGKRGHAL
jgi:O-antigen/teichoic acid export membrane protein